DLLKYEQSKILQPLVFDFLGHMPPPIPSVLSSRVGALNEGGTSFKDYYKGKILPIGGKLVTVFDDRWGWLEKSVMPYWNQYRKDKKEDVKKFVQDVIEADKKEFGG